VHGTLDALDGMYTVAVTFPQFAEYGLWKCEFQADDVVRNRLDLQGSQLVALGFTGFISNDRSRRDPRLLTLGRFVFSLAPRPRRP